VADTGGGDEISICNEPNASQDHIAQTDHFRIRTLEETSLSLKLEGQNWSNFNTAQLQNQQAM